MNCIIPGPNLKILGKALQALSKIGDELYLEARKNNLTLITLNLSKTVCARFSLLDSFFSSYEIDKDELNAENNETLTCKVHLKVFLPPFKGNLEKKLDFLKIEFDPIKDFITFKMKYKQNDILMLHHLRLMDPETLSIRINTNFGSNNICASSSLFNDLLMIFSTSDDEITFEISKNRVTIRNYHIGAPCRPKATRTQTNLNPTEFSKFQINKETSVNFSLKPLRTAIHFAEGFNLNIGFNFENGGKPLTMIMKNSTFEVHFIVATLNPYVDMESSMTTNSIPTSTNKVSTLNGKIIERNNLNIEDVQALDSENWENDNEMGNKNDDKIDKVDKFKLPESPRTKRAKIIFGRCYEPSFKETETEEVLADNSDSE